MHHDELFRRTDAVTRRRFMAGCARGLLGVGALPLFASPVWSSPLLGDTPVEEPLVLGPATARNVIYLYMSGGMSQLDTFDVKPGSETQGPTEVIDTNADGIRVSANFPNVARQMDKIAVINSMFTNQGAHAQGRYLMHTSYELRGTIEHPSMGAWLGKMAGKTNPTLPGHVLIGGTSGTATGGFFESQFAPLPIGDPEKGLAHSKLAKDVSQEAFERRMKRLGRMNDGFRKRYGGKRVRAYDEMYDQAVKLMKSSDLQAFDISNEPDSIRQGYGRDKFGQGCLLARRLIEHDVRYVEVVLGGWDTHSENFEQLDEKCPPLDRALAALLADLDARGLLEETLVVLATEFGRTPTIRSERNGRDHYPKAFSCLMAGGGIAGGRRYGATDATGAEIIDNKVTVQDFNATIATALGLPTEHIIYSPSGRPFRVANKGKAVMELFA